jgi:hypothetical protein
VTTRSTVLGIYVTTGTREYKALYLCPVGTVALVKSVFISNRGLSPANVRVLLQSPDGTVGTYLIFGPLPVDEGQEWEGWAVLEPNQYLVVYADQPNVHVWASGAVLPGP